MLFGHLHIHSVSHIAIREMSRWPGPQLSDVKRFCKIHLKERALSEAHGKQINTSMRIGSRGKLITYQADSLHRALVTRVQAGSDNIRRRVITMQSGKSLVNLCAAAVAMHIAEAANVHQNVKGKLLAAMEAPQELIMRPAMAQAKIDNLVALRDRKGPHLPPHLAI